MYSVFLASRLCVSVYYEHFCLLSLHSVLHFISSTLSMSYGPRMRPGRCRENDRATGPRESHRRGYVQRASEHVRHACASPFRGPVLEHLIFPLSVRVAESSRLPREGGSKRDEQTGEQGEQRRACAGRERDWAPRGASREAYGACKQGAHRVYRHVPYSTDSRFEASRGFGAPL